MKQAILFDFWQTLFVDNGERETFASRKQLVADYLENHGIPSPPNLDEAFKESIPWFVSIYHRDQRTPTVEERLEWVLNGCGIKLPPVLLDPLAYEFGELGLSLDPLPTPHIKEVLEKLSHTHPLGIVSDTGYTPGRVLRRHMQNHGILDCFSSFSFSNESGHAKPHRGAFLLALNHLNVDPANAIHCGDLLDHDILGAQNLGLTSVLYTGCHVAETDGIVPDYSIADWLELPEIVDKVFG